MPVPKAADLFGDTDNPMEIADRFESYKISLTKSANHPMPPPGIPTLDGPVNELVQLHKSLDSPDVVKALSPELLDSVRTSLANIDLGKDILVGSGGQLGGTGGLNAYDLEAPFK